jgi:hypothetical protein
MTRPPERRSLSVQMIGSGTPPEQGCAMRVSWVRAVIRRPPAGDRGAQLRSVAVVEGRLRRGADGPDRVLTSSCLLLEESDLLLLHLGYAIPLAT